MEANMTERSGRRKHRVFRILVVFLWIFVSIIGLEAGQRVVNLVMWVRKVPYLLSILEQRAKEDATTFEASVAHAPQPPPGLYRELPLYETFAGLDESGRQEFATQRRAILMICEPDGIVSALYAGSQPTEIVALAAKFHVGGSLAEDLPPDLGQDVYAAVKNVCARNNEVSREYPIPLSGSGEGYFACDVSFRPFTKDAQRALVCMQESRFQKIYYSYRPHIYRDSNFDHLFWFFRRATFWTNTMGFRNEDVTPAKPPGVYRIVCVGGSTTVEGPRNDLTYPKYLERRLQKYFNNNTIEVFNCGVERMSTWDVRRRVNDYLSLQPDLIIDYPFANDVKSVWGQLSEQGIGRTDPRHALLPLLGQSAFLARHAGAWVASLHDDIRPRIESISIANEQGILEAARAQGTAMAICSLAYPDFSNLNRMDFAYYDPRIGLGFSSVLDSYVYARIVDTFNECLGTFCAREGVVYVPVAEELKGGANMFADLCHLHLDGIERKADIVFSHIKDHVGAHLPPAGDAK